MRIKHSKYRNTGLIFELLVKQIAADTLNNTDSPAVGIIKKFFTGKTALVREFKLYDYILKKKNITQPQAENIISTIIEVSRKLDTKILKKEKYELIKEIKDKYDIDEFFSIKTSSYKPLAALYCLLEAHKSNDFSTVDADFLIDNKMTLLEHLTHQQQDKEEVKETLIEEYSKYDKDLKLLTFKILLEKFNSKYQNLLPEQKNILKEFITSVNSSNRLRNLVNQELVIIRNKLDNLSEKVEDQVTLIKLTELAKGIEIVPKTKQISDNHLVDLMQYYELVNEINSI